MTKDGWLHSEIVKSAIYLQYIEDINAGLIREKNGIPYPRNHGVFLLPITGTSMYGRIFDRKQISVTFKKDGRDLRAVKLAIIPVHRINHFFVIILIRPDLILEVIKFWCCCLRMIA